MSSKWTTAILTLGVLILVSVCVWIVVGPSNSPNAKPIVVQTLDGTWKTSSDEKVVLTAEVQNGEITIKWGSKEDATFSSLYWKGTFPSLPNPIDGLVIDSEGDINAMRESLMGSMNKTKTFAYENGKLSFEFTSMGVTRALQLESKG